MKKPKRGEENQNIEDWTDTANFDQKKMSVQLYRRIRHKNFQKALNALLQKWQFLKSLCFRNAI